MMELCLFLLGRMWHCLCLISVPVVGILYINDKYCKVASRPCGSAAPNMDSLIALGLCVVGPLPDRLGLAMARAGWTSGPLDLVAGMTPQLGTGDPLQGARPARPSGSWTSPPFSGTGAWRQVPGGKRWHRGQARRPGPRGRAWWWRAGLGGRECLSRRVHPGGELPRAKVALLPSTTSTFEATRVGEDTTLPQMSLVEEASGFQGTHCQAGRPGGGVLRPSGHWYRPGHRPGVGRHRAISPRRPAPALCPRAPGSGYPQAPGRRAARHPHQMHRHSWRPAHR